MKAATTVSNCCIFLEAQQSLQNSRMKLILFAILIAFTANKVTGLDEIRARILVQYHPTWEQERGLRGSTIGHYLRNIHRTNKILSNVPGSDVVLTEEIVQHGVVLLECFANAGAGPEIDHREGFTTKLRRRRKKLAIFWVQTSCRVLFLTQFWAYRGGLSPPSPPLGPPLCECAGTLGLCGIRGESRVLVPPRF